MPEAVDTVSRLRHDSEFLQEIILRNQCLSGKRFPGRNITVRLDPPSAAENPSSLMNSLSDFFKHRRIVLFNPFVELRRTGSKNKIIKFFHPIQCRPECSFILLKPFLPVPQPNRIQMRTPDHMHCYHSGISLLSYLLRHFVKKQI